MRKSLRSEDLAVKLRHLLDEKQLIRAVEVHN